MTTEMQDYLTDKEFQILFRCPKCMSRQIVDSLNLDHGIPYDSPSVSVHCDACDNDINIW